MNDKLRAAVIAACFLGMLWLANYQEEPVRNGPLIASVQRRTQ